MNYEFSIGTPACLTQYEYGQYYNKRIKQYAREVTEKKWLTTTVLYGPKFKRTNFLLVSVAVFGTQYPEFVHKREFTKYQAFSRAQEEYNWQNTPIAGTHTNSPTGKNFTKLSADSTKFAEKYKIHESGDFWASFDEFN